MGALRPARAGGQARAPIEIDDAGNYPDAAVGDGWIANNELVRRQRGHRPHDHRRLAGRQRRLPRPTRRARSQTVHAEAYEGAATLEDLQHQVQSQTDYTDEEWLAAYEDGTVLDIVGTAEQAYVELGGVPEYVEPSEFFDTSLFIEQAKAHLE